MRRHFFGANWKMYKTGKEAQDYFTRFLKGLPPSDDREIVFFPPFTALEATARALAGYPRLAYGAQDLHWEAEGPFTGAVSGRMIQALGATYVLVGHSERRQVFAESDEVIVRKLAAARAAGLKAVLCVGETLSERETGLTWTVVERQLDRALAGWPKDLLDRLVVAYEPVWAIGTGRVATPDQAAQVHAAIRAFMDVRCGSGSGEVVRVIYGGSVTPQNAAQLLGDPELDGALVGGSSLDPQAFRRIVFYDRLQGGPG